MFHWLYSAPDAWPPVAAFGSKPKIPDPPNPLPMPPTADDPALLAEKRRRLERRMAATGSVSTMLTDDGAYSGDKLGLR